MFNRGTLLEPGPPLSTRFGLDGTRRAGDNRYFLLLFLSGALSMTPERIRTMRTLASEPPLGSCLSRQARKEGGGMGNKKGECVAAWAAWAACARLACVRRNADQGSPAEDRMVKSRPRRHPKECFSADDLRMHGLRGLRGLQVHCTCSACVAVRDWCRPSRQTRNRCGP